MEDVVESPPEPETDVAEPEEEDDDIAGIKKFLDDGKDDPNPWKPLEDSLTQLDEQTAATLLELAELVLESG